MQAMASDSPLGKSTSYPDRYAPSVLHPIARAESRSALELGDELPFYGVDIWNAWELSWLEPQGKPVAAIAQIRVAASSRNIVESKSLKLYLNSFSMSRFGSMDEVAGVIERDLRDAAGGAVNVTLSSVEVHNHAQFEILPGTCIDSLDVACDAVDVDPGLLSVDAENTVAESLHSHLLRSLCPVTRQPDLGSVLIQYSGAQIDASSLLRYIVSFRKHNDFHEACVERMFQDIQRQCAPSRLTVYARYQRRGGIDINPYRSTDASEAKNLRLWRQ
jgi:7-cyano-7-deazaguanine reductase